MAFPRNFVLHSILVLTVGVSVMMVILYLEPEEEGREFPQDVDENGTRWAVLVAGSKGFKNYRHQADICRAYQILKRGGLKDEEIVVFMYDDMAMHEQNPRKGVLINHPYGEDVYSGVPKDYTGKQVHANNFYAVILGDKGAVKGGSGKVVNSTSRDRIFIYYSGHGADGILDMPNLPVIHSKRFINVLKKKHASRTYKEMVIYIEACRSGSLFERLPDNLNIYVMTAAKPKEESYAKYCFMVPLTEDNVWCLGNEFSAAWMEDSESHNRKTRTIEQQYQQVKKETFRSHVMEYGNTSTGIKSKELYLFQGFNPTNQNFSNSINSTNQIGVVDQMVVEEKPVEDKYFFF